MKAIILDNILFEPNLGYLYEHLHVPPSPAQRQIFDVLAAQAAEVARPRALYGLSAINELGDDFIVVEKIRFDSRVLAVNVKSVHRVFPFVVTCGAELVQWADGISDMLKRFYADALKQAALDTATRFLEKEIQKHFDMGHISQMSPGSLSDWPLEQQRPLFDLLGDTQSTVGVKLTSSMVMLPDKSESGFYFQSESEFTSCQLCPIKKCSSRKVPFVENFYEEKYQK
ncbi:vitamin B12 dependent-methionine synthase activation domain-containing protein [Desulfobacterales bacterium HSG17]|nr:vitamin B12 dependent-methionine synthase activation domain-containing protein [Desulfobacterales bacterium HSG17]